MTPAERARLLRMILDEHVQAMFELRESRNKAFDAGISSMRQSLAALQSANHAQRRAIDRVMAANKLATKLFNDEDSP